MRVLAKAPRGPLHVEHINNDIEEMQNLIRGFVEVVYVDENWAVLCDENAKLRNRPFNCKLGPYEFYGKIAFVGVEGNDLTGFSYKFDKPLKTKYPELVGR